MMRARPATALPIPPGKSSPTGSCCAIPRARHLSSATRPSSPPIRIGRARHCCAGAPRRGCGRRRATRRPCTPSRWTGRPAPRATSRWRACCSPRATATGQRVWCARPGARRSCPNVARRIPTQRSAIFSPLRIIAPAWTSGSAQRTTPAQGARPSGSAKTRSRSSRPVPRLTARRTRPRTISTTCRRMPVAISAMSFAVHSGISRRTASTMRPN